MAVHPDKVESKITIPESPTAATPPPAPNDAQLILDKMKQNAEERKSKGIPEPEVQVAEVAAAQSEPTLVQQVVAREGEESIIYPEEIKFELGGVTYDIVPMVDAKIIRTMADMNTLTAVLTQVVQDWQIAAEDNKTAYGVASLGQADVIVKIPEIITALIPRASAIIAINLGLTEEFVANNCPMYKKIEALTKIMKAEHIELILKNIAEMSKIFSPGAASLQARPATPTV